VVRLLVHCCSFTYYSSGLHFQWLGSVIGTVLVNFPLVKYPLTTQYLQLSVAATGTVIIVTVCDVVLPDHVLPVDVLVICSCAGRYCTGYLQVPVIAGLV